MNTITINNHKFKVEFKETTIVSELCRDNNFFVECPKNIKVIAFKGLLSELIKSYKNYKKRTQKVF